MAQENKKNTDPAAAANLGYQTYFNNFITQTFLKIRTVIFTAVISLFITFFIELFFNKSLLKMFAGWVKFFKLEGLNAFDYSGFLLIIELLEKSAVILFYALLDGSFIFVISLTGILIFLHFKSKNVYQKKYLRGTEVIDEKEFCKRLNEEIKSREIQKV
jgi:hypothetical protein